MTYVFLNQSDVVGHSAALVGSYSSRKITRAFSDSSVEQNYVVGPHRHKHFLFDIVSFNGKQQQYCGKLPATVLLRNKGGRISIIPKFTKQPFQIQVTSIYLKITIILQLTQSSYLSIHYMKKILKIRSIIPVMVFSFSRVVSFFEEMNMLSD